MRYFFIISITILTTMLYSCKRNNIEKVNEIFQYIDSSAGANVKIVHCFAGNTPQLPTAANLTTGPQVFFYADGKKLNGNALSYAGAWPSPQVYATVAAGSNVRIDVVMARLNLAVVPNRPAPIVGDTLVSFNTNLEKGKFYSFYFGDSVPTYKVTVKEDNLTPPAYQTFKIRLANFLMDPMDTLEARSRITNQVIFQNVAHKDVTPWVEIPLPVLETDTLDIKIKGAATNLTPTTGLVLAATGLRMYTVVARGKRSLAMAGKAQSFNILTNR
jgi:hypothetical protein